jgi:hypothetical protein
MVHKPATSLLVLCNLVDKANEFNRQSTTTQTAQIYFDFDLTSHIRQWVAPVLAQITLEDFAAVTNDVSVQIFFFFKVSL